MSTVGVACFPMDIASPSLWKTIREADPISSFRRCDQFQVGLVASKMKFYWVPQSLELDQRQAVRPGTGCEQLGQTG